MGFVEEFCIPMFKFFVCIGVVLLIGAIINIIKDKVKGKAKQKILMKRDISNCDIDVLILTLKKIKGYNKIIVNNKYIMRITEYNIDVILVCDYYGILYGNEEDLTWNFKSDQKNEVITNPTIEFKKYIEEIKEKIGNYQIREYILLGGNTISNIQFKEIEVVRRSNILYVLSEKKYGKKYTKEEIDSLYNKLVM